MRYQSTRDSGVSVSSAQAITKGLSAEGGLFVPVQIPQLPPDFLSSLCGKSYIERAKEVLSLFLTDFPEAMLSDCVEKAYAEAKFENDEPAPLSHLYEGRYLLELWHGPTCAFKDMALQLLPHLMTNALALTKNDNELVILVATSGDTGKAALEGFRDVANTDIIVFYPIDGVSPMQKRQMISQEGKNVHVCGIKGNFDDAQTAVKSIFTDEALINRLAKGNPCRQFSSANSINWGRLVPQIVYYISAYAGLVQNEEIRQGEKVNVCVPTGNFGNILAAYYAKKMGVPFDKLICASNKNNVLTDFIETGIYDKNREFYTTTSPSMDILVSSNLERLLYDLSDCDDKAVSGWLHDLNEKGSYEVSESVKARLHADFACGWCDDKKAAKAIADTFAKYSYLCDPHTAVAVAVYEDYRKNTGDEKSVIIASTANPYKFTSSVLSVFEAGVDATDADEFAQMEKLFSISNMEVPAPLCALADAKPLHNRVIDKTAIADEVMSLLSL